MPVLSGTFDRSFWIHEQPLLDLVGPGTLTVTDDGLQISATFSPLRRRQRLYLLSLLAFVLAASVLAGLGAPAAAVVPVLLLVAAGGPALAVRSTRSRPFAQLIPWGQLRRPGISDGALCFEVHGPIKGLARFRVPGAGLRELQPIARELVRRSTGS